MRHLSEGGLLILTTLAGTIYFPVTALHKVHSGFRKSKILNKNFSKTIKEWKLKYNTLSNMHAQLRTDGYGYEDDSRFPGTGYGHSLISRRWMEVMLAGESYSMVDYVERGWDNYQDVILVKKNKRSL
jgi:hypothetical protein